MSDTQDSKKSGNDLRRTFVAMLFALVIADLATKSSAWLLFYFETNGISASSSGSMRFSSSGLNLLIASATHLCLGLALVSMSWVGWSNSQSAGNRKRIDSFLSAPFLLLIVEVLLVILYFMLSRTAEYPSVATNSGASYGVVTAKKASAVPEALILFLVFLVYSFWDLVSDVFVSPRKLGDHSERESVLSFTQGILTYCSVSIICSVTSYLVYEASKYSKDPVSVIAADLALFSVLFFFYSGKRLEYYLTNIFPRERARENTKYDRSLKYSDFLKIFLSVLFFLIFFMNIDG